MDRRELIRQWMNWKTERDEVQYTYRSLARDAGLNPNYLSNIMTGIRNPGVKTLHRIAEAFGVSLSEFFRGPSESVAEPVETVEHARPAEPAAPRVESTTPQSTVTTDGKSDKLGLKLSKSDDEGFDRIFSTYGFESSEFLRTGSGFPGVSGQENGRQDSVRLRKGVNKAFSGSEAVDIPLTDTGAGSAGASRVTQPASQADCVKEAPLLEDGFTGDFGEWIKGFSERGDEYRAVTRTFTVEGKRVLSYFMRDDSMAPVIGEGDLLFVDLDEAFTRVDGGIGLVRREGVITVRRVFEEDDYWRLSPVNPDYGSGVVPKKETDVLKIVLWLPRTDDKF